MNLQKSIAGIFIVIALGLGFDFYSNLFSVVGLEDYFKREYYNQLGPIALCVELFIAGLYLFRSHPGTNFTLALFAFTALLDPIFNAIGLFDSNVPIYGSMLFIFCAIPALWIAFTNTFNLGKISILLAVGSFLSGLAIELFFNYW